jgi:hypothetical protein
MNSLRMLMCGGLAALTLTACTPGAADAPAQTAQPQGTEQLKPEYDAAGKLQKLEYDRNKDGKVDTWGYMDGARVVRVEVDENSDGKIDRWEYHRSDDSPAGTAAGAAAAPGVDRSVERIERATKFDGTVSRREYFENGALTKIEEDTDGNGKVDKWETYTGGSLALMALDTQGRGTPDRRLVYRPDGSMDHIEADPNGTGTFTALNP